MDFATCPRCQLEMDHDRQKLHPVICNHCGFTSSKHETKIQHQVEARFIKVALVIALILVASFVQVANWDSHFLRVIPLQVKSLVGVMEADDYEAMAEICMDRKKYNCVERMYAKTASQSLDHLARYANFLVKREKVRLAAYQYKSYFDQGGVDLLVTYNYAKTLAQLGEFDQAAQLFQQVIDSKPETVQVTVIQNYVRALINANQLEKAKSIIEDVRHKSAQANAFMAEEMAQIQDKSS